MNTNEERQKSDSISNDQVECEIKNFLMKIKLTHRLKIAKMFLVGAIQGPINHYFYGWIDRAIRTVNLKNVSKKILLDQLIMSPVCIVAFFYSAGLVDGQSTNECTDELKSKFLTVYTVNECFMCQTYRILIVCHFTG